LRLVTTSGWLKGTAWPANDGPLSLGRDASNQIVVSDAAVSRRHCSVSEVTGGVFKVADLDSHNGTLLNGTKVSRKTIRHGDRIRIGSSEYVFLTGPDETALGRSPSGGHEDSSGFVTVALDRSGMPSDASGVGRMARDLSAFFKIANVINSTRDALALQRELLALISEVIPAAQGAIVLQPNSNEESSAPCIWNRNGLPRQEMLIRQELVQQATWERCAVFTAAGAEPVTPEHVLCVPLAAPPLISRASSGAETQYGAY
jgi:pSer/pThr/pTyr-binding forkhead associated (FHA) protein